MEGHAGTDLLTPLDYNAFLSNHLTRLLHQRQLLDDEITRVREFLNRMGTAAPQQAQTVSLPALLLDMTRQPWEDGQPMIRLKRDWYFVLRALAELNILHQDSYSDLLSLLRKAQIPQSLIPTRQLLSITAADFGQYQVSVSEWKQKGKRSASFRRWQALATHILRNLNA